MTVEFTQRAITHLTENLPRIEKCLNQLSEEEVWQRPNSSSNSVGNLLLHLCGNVGQYILSSLAGRPDVRERDAEFAAKGGLDKAALMDLVQMTVKNACEVIGSQDRNSLLTVRSVQGFQMSGIAIVMHVVEHFSYHVGQIAFWTKQLRDQDLGFYEGINLNQKNEA